MQKIIILTIISIILFSMSGCVDKESKYGTDTNISDTVDRKDIEYIKNLSESTDPYQRLIADSKNVVKIAIKDLSTKLNISEDEIIIDTIVPVEWPDTSFGYPEEGEQYDMNFTPGYVMLLMAEEKLYEYHTDREYKVVPPPNYLPIEDVPLFEDTKVPKVVRLAMEDLAKKLQISIEKIKLSEIIPIEWPDTSLGYHEPGKIYAQVITPGYIILLTAEDEIYEYHSDYERVVGPVNMTEYIIYNGNIS